MRRWKAIFVVTVFAFSASAASAADAAGPTDAGKVLMWKATSPTATVYLLGTIHFSSDRMYPLDPAIEKAFAESDTLVMEISMSLANEMKAAMLTLQKGSYDGVETLADHVSAETLAKVNRCLEERGLDTETFHLMRPWLLATMLVAAEYTKLGYDAAQGIDKHFYDKAAAAGMPVWDLETVEYQIAVFSEGGDEVQELSLVDAIDRLGDAAGFLKDMTAAWQAGDASAVDRLLRENMSTDERLKPMENRLLYGRNEKMIEKIDKLFGRNGTYFVMIGAGHLVGEKGIVAALAAKGYSVAQVDKAAMPEPAAEGEPLAAHETHD